MEGGEAGEEEVTSPLEVTVTEADLARLLDPYSEEPDPGAARASTAAYLEDIHSYMRMLSMEELRRPRDYMPMILTEDVVNPHWRANLVDWLVVVADLLALPADTLHLAVSCVDRFLSVRVIFLSQLQLLGLTALLVAVKYEDDTGRRWVEFFCDRTNNIYTQQQVVKMEADILNTLKFEIGSPTARTFLRRYITACRPHNQTQAKELEFLCSYLAELSLLDYDCTRFKPSVVAAACLFLAMFTMRPNTRSWNLTLQRNTNYMLSDLKSCILTIHHLHLTARNRTKEAHLFHKYSHYELESVSYMAPPKEIYEYFLTDIKE